MSKQIILIGGMPAAGKSTVAENLSKQLNLPWFSTDQVGQIMREVATREIHPELFTWEDYDDMNYLNEYSADQIADNEFAKAESVWPGVRKLVKDDYTWHKGFIIEGDDILPHLVARDFPESKNVKAVFIGDHDIDRVRNVVFTRNFEVKNANVYADSLKEKEVEWVLNFSKKLKEQVLKLGFPWVEVNKNDRDLDMVLDALGIV